MAVQDQKCPGCGGWLLVIDGRAWCMGYNPTIETWPQRVPGCQLVFDSWPDVATGNLLPLAQVDLFRGTPSVKRSERPTVELTPRPKRR